MDRTIQKGVATGLIYLLVVCGTARNVQAQQVAEVERMVEGRAKKVNATQRASLQRTPPVPPPLKTGESLQFEDVLGLQNEIWIELAINRPDVEGHAILAEEGQYAIDAVNPEHPLRFRLRQGRMSVALQRGRLSVFLKNQLVEILGTEVFLQADPGEGRDLVYLKEGHIRLLEDGRVLLDVQGRERAWRLQEGQPPEEVTGRPLREWKKQMQYDARKVWRRRFFQRPWVRLGAVALVGAGVYYVLTRDRAETVRGTVVITIPD